MEDGKQAMAGKALGVGIIGAGYFGEVHARAIAATPGARLAAVCDRDLARARRLAAGYGGAAYPECADLFADQAIDVVAIATPHHWHLPMATAAAAAGKHILLEKPMGRTVAECTAIMEAAERHQRILMVGQVLHFALTSLTGRQILDRG